MHRLGITVLALLLVALDVGAEEIERFGRFGDLHLYRNRPHPAHVVLFVSGDGGWNLGVVDMAKSLAELDALVVGIDIRTYLKALEKSDGRCLYPASDFEALSQYLQKKLDSPTYQTPILIGYSSGATLVYATLAQSPPNTFRGGVSLGFCPSLDVARSFCKGSGLVSKLEEKKHGLRFDPVASIESPWIAFQGSVDQVCDATATERYVRQVKGAELVLLPKVGHGFSVQKNWMPQFREAFGRLTVADGTIGARRKEKASDSAGVPNAAGERRHLPDIDDLPVVEVPASGRASATLALIVSGDGGWASLDKQVAESLSAEGVSVVGLDALRYFWQARTPEESARAAESILRHYLAQWKKERLLLIGYSRGAGVLPFMATRLPADLLDRVDLIALLGPEKTISFEFRLADWIGGVHAEASLVEPEIEKLRGRKVVCLFGEDETDSPCPRLPPGLAKSIKLTGGHHFDGDYQAIAARILSEASR